jgi:hypothetical protein
MPRSQSLVRGTFFRQNTRHFFKVIHGLVQIGCRQDNVIQNAILQGRRGNVVVAMLLCASLVIIVAFVIIFTTTTPFIQQSLHVRVGLLGRYEPRPLLRFLLHIPLRIPLRRRHHRPCRFGMIAVQSHYRGTEIVVVRRLRVVVTRGLLSTAFGLCPAFARFPFGQEGLHLGVFILGFVTVMALVVIAWHILPRDDSRARAQSEKEVNGCSPQLSSR